LRALGLASPHDLEDAPAETRVRGVGGESLELPIFEALRLAACETAGELAVALGGSEPSGIAPNGTPTAAFRAAALAAEGRLAAPALLPLPTREVAEVLRLVAALARDPEQVRGGGQLVNALTSALRRRTLRRVRRILEPFRPEEIAALDFAAWRAELRALAASVALDESGIDLRAALLALIRETDEEAVTDLPEGADLTHLVARCHEARALLRRVVQAWQRRI
jgi:hypothetical protein